MSDAAARIANLSPEQRQLLERMLRERAQGRADKNIPALPRHSESGRPAVFPLSLVQRHVWYSEQIAFLMIPVAPTVSLRGPLDEAALEAGLQEVCARHEALRTTFEARDEEDGEPVQIVGPPRPVPLARIDLRELPPAARQAALRRFVFWEVYRHPFDLSRDLLLRAVLLRLDDEEHVLLLAMHHIVSDGVSADVLLRDLWALYEASRTGRPAGLSELPVQFADYVAWQRRLRDGALRGQMEYWKERLAGGRLAVALPTDCRSLPEDWLTAESRSREIPVPAGLERGLRALCGRQNATLFMGLLAAWAALLHRYSGQEDILLFTLFANRTRAEVEGLIGFFANEVVMRNDLGGDPPFAELLGRVRESALEGWSNGELPFVAIREALHPQLSTPFGIYFQFEDHRFDLELDGLRVERIDLDETGRYPLLYITMIEGNDGLRARLDYGILFEPATIERMLGDFLALLEGMVADPGRRISELPLATPVPGRAEG